jgi:hypothetical protein
LTLTRLVEREGGAMTAAQTTTTQTTATGWVLRIGSTAGIAGALLAMVGNLIHPATPIGDPEGVAATIADSRIWVPGHLAIVIGLVPMLGGLLALAQSIQDGLPGALASETLNFALAALFNILFAGVTFILYGLAVAWSRQYPRWLGWVVVAAGIGSVAAGLLQATVGEPTALSRVLTIIFPTVITLWLVDMNVLVLRRVASLERAAAAQG